MPETIIVTDLDYQWSSRTGATRYDLAYFLLNIAGWRYADVITIPQGDMKKDSPGDRLIEALDEARDIANAHVPNLAETVRYTFGYPVPSLLRPHSVLRLTPSRRWETWTHT